VKRTPRQCQAPGCGRSFTKHRGRWCPAHEARLRRHGDLRVGVPVREHGRSESERFWAFVEKTETCWLWTGHLNRGGYGVFTVGRAPRGAYVFAYVEAFGPIPIGLQIDHLCRVRRCVRPSHLEAVTPRVNSLRSDSAPARYSRRTHCANGHALVEPNLAIRKDGSRKCRRCHADYMLRWTASRAS
jgi:hypothetical protein